MIITKKELLELTKGVTFVSENLEEVLTFNYKTQSYYELNELNNTYTYNFNIYVDGRNRLVFLSEGEIQDYLYNYEFTIINK